MQWAPLMEEELEARLRHLQEAQRQLARARRRLSWATQKDEQILRDAFVLYVLEGCELHAPLLYAQRYSSTSPAVIKETLHRRFMETPLDELSNVGYIDGTFTPPVSKRCARFYEGFRIAARVRRLNEDVGVAPSWDSVSGDTNQSENCCARACLRTRTENEKHKKRWMRWRKRWTARVSKVMTQLGGNSERITAKVAPASDRETNFCFFLWAKKVAQNLGPKSVPLLLGVK